MSLVTALYTSLIVGSPDADDSSVGLKIGIFLLLLVLAVVSVVLIYFVQKKVYTLSHISSQTHAYICT